MPRGRKSQEPASLNELSYEELQKLLAAKKAERVQALQARRQVLCKAISDLGAELQALGVGTVAEPATGPAGSPTAVPSAESPVKGTRRPRKRAARGAVKGMIVAVLSEAGKPLALKQIMAALEAKGFRSSSRNPARLVMGYLAKMPAFARVGKGLYELAK